MRQKLVLSERINLMRANRETNRGNKISVVARQDLD